VKLSVFRTLGWTEVEIVAQGEQVAAEREAKHREGFLLQGKEYPNDKVTFRYVGRGEILAEKIRSVELDVVAEEPPPRHADIVNWPPLTGNRKHDESAQLLFAMKLQEKSVFVAADR
jgi:hypothetical protein